MIIDLHVHTIYSQDSLLAPEDLIEQALQVGLDGVCVMDHNSLQVSEVVEEFAEGTPLKVFRGVEVTTDLGHILAYGLKPEQWEQFAGRLERPAQELVDYVRSFGGVCIPAHPFRFGPGSIENKLETLIGIFAIEGYNGKANSDENQMACEKAKQLDLMVTGGSDAHVQGMVGKCATVFENKIETMADLIKELKGGHFEARYLF
jgi:predicted metal-dependent phosphoesterase TrpH